MQPADVGAVLLVASLNREALGVQDLGNRAHADAADAEDMDRAQIASDRIMAEIARLEPPVATVI